ncbi:c-type cytochrome biogenesis protein CcsB [Thermodesulfovibrionales bacterium]|nr:c-type cytochrome biogenesis protein CcsB [Thermodesulfovibrionales bacterium]MCL0062090.1 c-type cytochrome biogenesis protein CcsB [Thermodesulfovibrionales bacterium]MCL0071000.1 c-type cytochrome biogenesis protein CcsB [Thermodesulfovibrionales bacterium]MCL0086015.1 c-type cytochrome biogenesis protein CcsB [Thermodesulfovibrionales bacterium]
MDSTFFFGIAGIAYIIAMVTYIAYLVFKKPVIGVIATTITFTGFLSQTIAFLSRWEELNSLMQIGIIRAVPLTSFYESLGFFIWCVILSYLVIEWRYKNRSFGAFITPIAGMTLAFIDIGGIHDGLQPLVPALQSNWLLAHIILSFIAYGTFAIAFTTALMYLAVTTNDRKSGPYIFWTTITGLFVTIFIALGIDFLSFRIMVETPAAYIGEQLFMATFRSDSGVISLISYIASAIFIFAVWWYGYIFKRLIESSAISADLLDDLSYKNIAVGFPTFGVGAILIGAIWANEVWGRYWGWDPKETWSLITWLVYAFYLHARMLRGWRGTKIAIVAVIGFFSSLFTWLGVNFILGGLHTVYG